jgi:hypothetical protein
MGQALEVDRKVGVTLLERTRKWGNKLSKTEKQKKNLIWLPIHPFISCFIDNS